MEDGKKDAGKVRVGGEFAGELVGVEERWCSSGEYEGPSFA
jgi:hypothetical protein